MPIDLKWVRNHPEQVQEWQTQRGRAHSNSTTDGTNSEACLVDLVLQSDSDSREILSTLNGQRTQLKRLQQSLRPNKNNNKQQQPTQVNTNREQVLKEMKELQEQIRQLDQTCKEADQQTQKVLWQLASPIDTQVTTTCTTDTTHPPRKQKQQKASTIFQLSCNRGLDVAQAILQWTRRSFGDRYSVCRLPPIHNDWDPNMAHALWGCIGEEQCAICNNNTANLPSWLGVLRQIPPKSMFGDKQLPQYTAILDNDSDNDTFEIVAMTAGTVWDSRTVQQQLVQELLEFYSSLLLLPPLDENDSGDLSSSSSSLTTRAVPASQLNSRHELSRILIVLVTNNNNHDRILGWVSNFGDAASRAWDISFATGHKKKKEFVHFVHASVVRPETLTTILQSNSSRTTTTRNNNQTTREMVALPKCLSPYLILSSDDEDEEQDWLWIPLQALTTPPTNSGLAPPKPTTTRITGTTTKFPALLDVVPLSLSKPDQQQQQQVRLEALTSPFDFLFS
jgi:hypothetical protein